MLSSLTLSNVALIKKQTIEFKKGFNCILGQSGAGKSIIIDALNFSLGAKADKNLLRSGENNMRVDALFDDLSREVKDFLNELEIDVDDELIVTRTLSSEGKSSIKLNGFPVTAKTLKDLSEFLADFCGQHDSVGLLNVNNHLALLDKFAGVIVENLKEKVGMKFDELKEIEKKISAIGGDEATRNRTKDVYEFQISEIEDAKLKEGEFEELKTRFDFLSSAEKIFEKVNDALLKLDNQKDNANGLVYGAKSDLSGFSNFKDIEDCRQRLENCYYELKDIADTLEEVKESTEFDPLELERIDARLDVIKKLMKKYGDGLTEKSVLDFLNSCKTKLEELENSEFLIEKYQKQMAEKQAELVELCKSLSNYRKEIALILEKNLMAQLEDLEMKGTFFKVDFKEIEPTRKGFDAVKFMFSANRGQELKDLNKTASGGELSRLLLAFKNVLLDKEKIQTVVFDEIDSGISGHTAGKLATKLENISRFCQVICITHTPVVAAKADAFLLVEKKTEKENTISTVTQLEKEQAVKEVARLIDGGIDVSSTAIEHAKKLFED